MNLVILKRAKNSGTSTPSTTSPTQTGIATQLRHLDLSLQVSPTGQSPLSSPLRQPRFFTLSSQNSPTSPRPQLSVVSASSSPGRVRAQTTAHVSHSSSSWPMQTATDGFHETATHTAQVAASQPQPDPAAPFHPEESAGERLLAPPPASVHRGHGDLPLCRLHAKRDTDRFSVFPLSAVLVADIQALLHTLSNDFYSELDP